MRFFAILGVSQRAILTTKTANRLARACRQPVYDLVWQRARGMGKAEASGYIRAKAAVLMRRGAEVRVRAEPRLSATEHAAVAAQATEIVVQLVLSDVIRMRVLPPAVRKVA